jgi:hypothetical protein
LPLPTSELRVIRPERHFDGMATTRQSELLSHGRSHVSNPKNLCEIGPMKAVGTISSEPSLCSEQG